MQFDRESLSEQVEKALRDEIASGRLKPGQRVPVTSYQDAWNVSVTPLRDAMRSLEAQGFLRVAPRKGVFVADVNETMLHETFGVRIALETMAAELATARVPEDEVGRVRGAYEKAGAAAEAGDREALVVTDRLVHELTAQWCGNERLQRLLAAEDLVIRWAQSVVIGNLPDALERALPEHLAILDALAARDPAAAHQAMRRHLETSLDLTLGRLGVAEAKTAKGSRRL
jgi:DNA-binding GntR family transcriptional regulator